MSCDIYKEIGQYNSGVKTGQHLIRGTVLLIYLKLHSVLEMILSESSKLMLMDDAATSWDHGALRLPHEFGGKELQRPEVDQQRAHIFTSCRERFIFTLTVRKQNVDWIGCSVSKCRDSLHVAGSADDQSVERATSR